MWVSIMFLLQLFPSDFSIKTLKVLCQIQSNQLRTFGIIHIEKYSALLILELDKKRTRFVAVEELKTLVISKSEHTLSTDLGWPSTQLHKMQKNFKKGKKNKAF